MKSAVTNIGKLEITTPSDREVVLKTPMATGMSEGYDMLDGVLKSMA